MSIKLTNNTKKYLLLLARKTIAEHFHLNHLENMESESDAENRELKYELGAFVTLTKGGRLRGCIGYIEPIGTIVEEVKYLALQAALHDPRFRPLRVEEFHEIEIEITILSPLVRTSIEGIEVGRDGLLITKGNKKGVLLPQVPVEYGWDKFEFLKQLCLKANLPPYEWKNDDVVLEKFEGLVFDEKIFEG